MARLNPPVHNETREYVEAAAIGIAMAACLPLLGIAAFLCRGVLAGVVVVAIVLGLSIVIWRRIEPTLTPQSRAAVREVAIGSAVLALIPVIALGFVAVGGVVVVLIPVAGLALAFIGIGRILAAGRHIFGHTH